MRKTIKKYAGCNIIRLSPEEMKNYELEVGGCYEITFTKINNPEPHQKKNSKKKQ